MLPRKFDFTLKMPYMHHMIPNRYDYLSGNFYSWLFDRDRGGNRTTKFCLATYLIPLHMVWQCGGHQNRPTNAQETTRFGTWLPTSARPPRPTHPPPFTKVTNLGGQAPTHTLLTLVKNISVKLSLNINLGSRFRLVPHIPISEIGGLISGPILVLGPNNFLGSSLEVVWP